VVPDIVVEAMPVKDACEGTSLVDPLWIASALYPNGQQQSGKRDWRGTLLRLLQKEQDSPSLLSTFQIKRSKV
jgi:hypothetical protein